MEDGLKQRIYENILRFLENYRYIKSTAEATIPNFIFQNSPLLSLFYLVRFWGCPPFLTVRVRFSQLMAAPIKPISHPCAARFPTAEHMAGGCGFFCLASGSDLQYYLAVPHLWYSILRNITRPFFGVCLFRILFALGFYP